MTTASEEGGFEDGPPRCVANYKKEIGRNGIIMYQARAGQLRTFFIWSPNQAGKDKV